MSVVRKSMAATFHCLQHFVVCPIAQATSIFTETLLAMMSLVRKSTSATFDCSIVRSRLCLSHCTGCVRREHAKASRCRGDPDSSSSGQLRQREADQGFKRVLFFGPQAQPNDLEHLCAFYKVLATTYALLVFAIQHTVVDVPSCFAYSRRVQARQAQSIATLHIAVDVHWRLATTKATQSL